jgi:hypothetical protein
MGAVVKRCACSAEYDAASWDALQRAGRSTGPWFDGETWLDLRLCAACRSTITIEVEPPDVEAALYPCEDRP